MRPIGVFPNRRKIIPVAEAGYDRPRRVCAPCSAHLSAGDYTCPARYAVAIATPGADTYHKHGAIRHLSAAMEAAAKKTRPNIAVNGNASGSRVASGPLAALLRVHGGPTAFFAALSPMLSTEVGFCFNGQKGGEGRGWKGRFVLVGGGGFK